MACWLDAQGQVTSATKARKHVQFWRHPQRTPNPERKNFFKSEDSVDGLNSSLAHSVGDFSVYGVAKWNNFRSNKWSRTGLKEF